jgi:hypothetical protein
LDSDVNMVLAELSDAELDTVAVEVRRAARDGVLATALAVGRVLIERLFGGDVDAWRLRGARTTSLRRLAERLQQDDPTAPSSSALHRACGLYAAEVQLGVSALEHVTASHVYAVLGLPAEVQRDLLVAANDERLTTRALEERARAARPAHPSGIGRPRLPRFVKTIRGFRRVLSEPDALFGDLERVASLPDADVVELRAVVAELRSRCEQIEERLMARAIG